MIVILEEDITKNTDKYRAVLDQLSQLPDIEARPHVVKGKEKNLVEIYLIGNTATLDRAAIEDIDGVERVVRVSREYRILGRHAEDTRKTGFRYNGVEFSQDKLEIFAGLCAVDNPTNVEKMMRACRDSGLRCTRMGAYKPRTNPYSFQGLGADCLPWVFELAGKYGIKVIAMEVTSETCIEEISLALELAGNPTGVMLQVGTRNTQNFELLKSIGKQHEFPVLLKRGFGITLEESLNAAEYLASEGNDQVVFCLRGVKTNMGDPHRNLVDFGHVPTIKRLTRMPVCVDPSHSVGRRYFAPDNIQDIYHCTAQGVIAGANMILVDFHPDPPTALVDGAQALHIDELPRFCEDIRICRDGYLQRQELAARSSN